MCGRITIRSIGSGDGSPAFARGAGFVRMDVLIGNFPPQDADIVFGLRLTNVMRVSDLSEYTGSLRAELTVRRTDRDGVGGSTSTSTSVDFPYGFNAQCTSTPGSTLDASTCDALTSANAMVPGSVRDGLRAICTANSRSSEIRSSRIGVMPRSSSSSSTESSAGRFA